MGPGPGQLTLYPRAFAPSGHVAISRAPPPFDGPPEPEPEPALGPYRSRWEGYTRNMRDADGATSNAWRVLAPRCKPDLVRIGLASYRELMGETPNAVMTARLVQQYAFPWVPAPYPATRAGLEALLVRAEKAWLVEFAYGAGSGQLDIPPCIGRGCYRLEDPAE